MSLYDSLSFFGLMLALAAMPSASVALVVTRSAASGIGHGLAVSAGIVLGDTVFILLAVMGLSVVAETMGSLFIFIKILGGLYLIYLGFSLLRSCDTQFMKYRNTSKGSLFASFFAGFFLTLGDLKAMLFYVSLMPMFMDMTQVTSIELLTLILITILSVGSVKVTYVFIADKLARQNTALRLSENIRKAAGGMMIGTGGYLLLKS